jgi:hypothetical protein
MVACVRAQAPLEPQHATRAEEPSPSAHSRGAAPPGADRPLPDRGRRPGCLRQRAAGRSRRSALHRCCSHCWSAQRRCGGPAGRPVQPGWAGSTRAAAWGGQPKRCTAAEQERILQEMRRTAQRETDGTATWSLTTLQRALRRAPDGLPGVSTCTIWCVLHDAGFVWTKDRSWCDMGTAIRKRKSGTVTVIDPDAMAKKT